MTKTTLVLHGASGFEVGTETPTGEETAMKTLNTWAMPAFGAWLVAVAPTALAVGSHDATSVNTGSGHLAVPARFSSAAALRFGLNTAFPDFLPTSRYPGRDAEVPADHGHFLTVTATYNPAPVAEPATRATWVAGVAALLWRRGLTDGRPADLHNHWQEFT